MQHFRYKAMKTDGTVMAGNGSGVSRAEVLNSLKTQGLVVIRLDAVTVRKQRSIRVPRGFITRFYVMLGNQLQVGVPIMTAFQVIERQERSTAGKQLLSDLASRIADGQSLSAALTEHSQLFSEVDTNLLRAGEEGGFLPEAIERVASIRRWQQQLISGAWGAAAYPLLLIALALILIPAMLIYLVPKLEPIFASLRRDANLPVATSILLSISHISEEYGSQALAGLGVLILAIVVLVPREQLRLTADRFILRVPLVGDLVRDFVLARFFRILGTLLQNKIQILHSLNIAINVLGNRDMARVFATVPALVSSGKRLAESLEPTHRVPAELLAMIGVAEQSNSLDRVLSTIAEQLEAETNRRLEIIVKMIEPILLLFMALFVGFIVLALLMPIFEGQTLG